MPELNFQVAGAEVARSAAVPQIDFRLRVVQTSADREPGVEIRTVALRSMVRIEPARRRYSEESRERLGDLFGAPELWGQTVRSMLWANTSVVVPPFAGSVQVDLPVPCTFDFNVAITRYLHALDDGDVPLSFLFSGTVFYTLADGRLQIVQIPWDREAAFRLPVQVWKDLMDRYYPNSAWLCLRRDLFERLLEFKSSQGLATMEQALAALLPAEEVVCQPGELICQPGEPVRQPGEPVRQPEEPVCQPEEPVTP